MRAQWIKKLENNSLVFNQKKGVGYFTFPAFERTGLVKHGFSTRIGGVSKGVYASMNLSFTRGDRKQDVLENYRRIGKALDQDISKMVLSYQTHTANVRVVTEKDAGKGLLRERDYQDVDGLVTNVPDLMLVTFYADCVPLYLLDPVHRAIGLSHSGWRGTVKRMGRVTLEVMAREYGTDPEDVIIGIGPSICRQCYEVGYEVAKEFQKVFPDSQWNEILEQKSGEKFQLDLWQANRLIFLEAGVKPEHLNLTNTCTACNEKLLFSHRKTGDQRGNLAAFLALDPS